ncbi:MAG: hypothetical protein AABZ31_13510 [Bdellovibrionota bacterium]
MHLLKYMTFAVFILLSGCKSEDPTPELRDPIYNDLVKQQRDAEDGLKKSIEAVAKLEKEYAEQAPRTIDRKTTQKELFKEQEKVHRLTQEAEYYRIAALKRKAEATIGYKTAFAEDKTWPDPKEYESYKLNKKMRETSRNWSTRVPKLSNPLLPAKETSETKEE